MVRDPPDRGLATCHWPAGTSNVYGRFLRFSGGSAISRPALAPDAVCRIERSFARRSPGWRFMAGCRKSSTSGKRGSPTPTRRACHPAKHPARSPATTFDRSLLPPDAADGAGAGAFAPPPSRDQRDLPVGTYAIFELRASSIVLYGLASLSSVSARMTGHAGSNSLGLRLNFGLRGKP